MSRLFNLPLAAGLLLAVSSPSMLAASPATGTLLVDVKNVRNSSGLIHVDVCPQAQFIKEGCPFFAEAPAHAGMTEVVIHGLPAGHFAVMATHDENANHKVDRNFLGVPTEGIGFSRDARIVFGPPKWADAVIAFDGHSACAAFRMRYFSGPSGPTSR